MIVFLQIPRNMVEKISTDEHGYRPAAIGATSPYIHKSMKNIPNLFLGYLHNACKYRTKSYLASILR